MEEVERFERALQESRKNEQTRIGKPSKPQYHLTCRHCSQEMEWVPVTIWDDKPRWVPAGCHCEDAAEAVRLIEQERMDLERDQTIETLRTAARIHEGKWAEMTLDQWDVLKHPAADQAYDLLRSYLKEGIVSKKNWLYICGPYGTGKTHLGIAAIHAVVEWMWISYAVVWPEHCAAVQETWAKDSQLSEGQLWERMRNAKALLIDDLDKRQSTPWAIGKLYEILELRYRLERATIITANRSMIELGHHWKGHKSTDVRDAGEAILSRIAGQLYGVIEMEGEDQRWWDK